MADGGAPLGAPRLGVFDTIARLLSRLSSGVGAPAIGLRRDPARVGTGVSLGRRSRSARDLATIERRARAQYVARFGAEPDDDTTQDTARLARDMARTLEYEVHVRGSHGRGVSHQAILEYRKAEGRDFTADSAALRAHVRSALVAHFRAGEWDTDAATTVASSAILEWIVRRIDGDVRDVPIAPLSPAYAIAKARAGYGGKPIGVRTGEWRDAVAKQGDVEIVSSH